MFEKLRKNILKNYDYLLELKTLITLNSFLKVII